MANDYYNATEIIPLTRGRSRVRNDEFNAVEDGFDKLPTLAQFFGGLATFAGDSTGSSNAYAVTMPKTRTSNADGEEVVFVANHTNTGAATLNVDGIGAVALVDANGDALTAGVIESGLIYEVRYDATNTRFQMVGPGGDLAFLDTVDTAQIENDAVTTVKIADLAVTTAKLAANAVTTAKITDANVTLAKLANMASDRLLGRDTAGSGVPEALTVGGGLGFTGSGGIEISDGGVATAKIANSSITSAKMALDAGLTVAGGDVIMDAGEGLDLSANAGTAAAGAATTSEILSWFEQGTWTPALVDASNNRTEATHSVQTGYFMRIGEFVFVVGSLSITAKNTLSGPLTLDGLPFTALGSATLGAGIVTSAVGLNSTAGHNLTLYTQAGGNDLIFAHWDLTGGHSLLTDSEITDTFQITFAGLYKI